MLRVSLLSLYENRERKLLLSQLETRKINTFDKCEAQSTNRDSGKQILVGATTQIDCLVRA
jgi:hypothetical protein